MIITAITADPPAQYGPTILWALGIAAPFLIAFGAWVTVSLSKINSALAILITKDGTNTPNITKVVNEVIDLKLATGELNQAKINMQKQLDWLITRANNEITEDHDTVNRKRRSTD